MHCGDIYLIERGSCPNCGKSGGYLQEPSLKQFGKKSLHLEDVLIHCQSKNKYKIKEFQKNGIIAVLLSSPIIHENASKGMRVYISNETVKEYKI